MLREQMSSGIQLVSRDFLLSLLVLILISIAGHACLPRDFVICRQSSAYIKSSFNMYL
jgi:hypothetical protein